MVDSFYNHYGWLWMLVGQAVAVLSGLAGWALSRFATKRGW